MARPSQPWFASKNDKKPAADKTGIEINPIPWHVFEYAIRARLPLAVSLLRFGELIYAVAPTGRRRLVGLSAGVEWPRGVGTEYDMNTHEFRKAPPDFVPGRVTGPYLRDIYPEARIEAARLNEEAKAKPRTIFGKRAAN